MIIFLTVKYIDGRCIGQTFPEWWSRTWKRNLGRHNGFDVNVNVGGGSVKEGRWRILVPIRIYTIVFAGNYCMRVPKDRLLWEPRKMPIYSTEHLSIEMMMKLNNNKITFEFEGVAIICAWRLHTRAKTIPHTLYIYNLFLSVCVEIYDMT